MRAEDGTTYLCQTCGKTAKDKDAFPEGCAPVLVSEQDIKRDERGRPIEARAPEYLKGPRVK